MRNRGRDAGRRLAKVVGSLLSGLLALGPVAGRADDCVDQTESCLEDCRIDHGMEKGRVKLERCVERCRSEREDCFDLRREERENHRRTGSPKRSKGPPTDVRPYVEVQPETTRPLGEDRSDRERLRRERADGLPPVEPDLSQADLESRNRPEPPAPESEEPAPSERPELPKPKPEGRGHDDFDRGGE